MMLAIVLIYHGVRFVCIITDPEESRCIVYRLVLAIVVLLGLVLGWMVIADR